MDEIGSLVVDSINNYTTAVNNNKSNLLFKDRENDENMEAELAEKKSSNKNGVDDNTNEQHETTVPIGKEALPSIGKEALENLEKAILKLPSEENKAYLRAKESVPELVEKESNPIWYLKFAKNDIQSAAKRICAYWKFRCEFFDDRAFLPMNQTGEGAISKNDILVMSTAYWTYLPRDGEGRSVMFSDYSWLARDCVSSRIRNLFYMHHALLQNEKTVEKGCVVILFLSQATLDVLSGNSFNGISVPGIWASAFPFRISNLIIVPKVKTSDFIKQAVPFVTKCFEEQWSVPKENQSVHRHHSSGELVRALQKSHGLKKDGLPEILGGNFTLEHFVMWQERQIRVEWELPLGQLDAFEFGHYSARPLNQLSEEEKIERKRRYNILHSRRKRRRDRVEADVVNKQVEKLKLEQVDLRAESDRLELLLANARHMLSDLGLEAPPIFGQKSNPLAFSVPPAKKQRVGPALFGIERRLAAQLETLAQVAPPPATQLLGPGVPPDLGAMASPGFPSLVDPALSGLRGIGHGLQTVDPRLVALSTDIPHSDAPASLLATVPTIKEANPILLQDTNRLLSVPVQSQFFLPISNPGQPTLLMPVDAATAQSLSAPSRAALNQEVPPSSLRALMAAQLHSSAQNEGQASNRYKTPHSEYFH